MINVMHKKYFIYAVCIALSLIFVTFASYSTSPLYPYCYGSDSAQFQTIGKAWVASILPYKEIFDHKGPLIFLINALGYAIAGSKHGIYLLQVVFFALTLHAIFLLTRFVTEQISLRTKYFIALCFLFIIFLGEAYEGGNLTEEYCLPFLMYSTYFQMLYILEKPNIHQKYYAILYGLTFAVCLLTRVTNAIALLCGLACIFFSLLAKKQYKNIVENIILFLVGFGFPVLLFCVYFYCKNALYDCCYGTLFYNLEYQKFMVSWLKNISLWRIYDFILSFFAVYAMFFVAYCAWKRQNHLFLIFSLLICISELYLFLSGALYIHYAVAVFPQFVIVINEAVRMFNNICFTKKTFLCWQTHLVLIFLCITYLNAQDFSCRVARNYIKYNSLDSFEYANIGDIIKKKFHGKPVAIYGGENCKSFYLIYDFLPCYKYFVLQEWHARFSPKIKEDVRSVFSENKAEAILVCGSDENIRDILTAGYRVIASSGTFSLYQKIAL